ITRQLRPRNASAIVEEAVSCGSGSAIVFTQVAVEVVGTTLGHQLDLAAAASALGSTGVGRNCTELLNRVDRSVTNRRSELARGHIVRVDTIDGDVALVSARTSH